MKLKLEVGYSSHF